ncbi:MAG: hypothetical protein HZA93_09480 [Verrucomicrobia bacterium]|nr:hypothetical protein [Verrucomicrobiota bacterium]
MSNEELVAVVKKNPLGIGCGVLSLALFGGWYYRSGDVPAVEQEVAQKAAEAQRYELNLIHAKSLPEQHEALVAANKEVDARLVRASQLGKNVQFFYKLESESGAKLTTDPRQAPLAPPAKNAAKTAYNPVAFSVTVSGDLPQLLRFLRRLESGVHYSRVLGASCTVPQERSLPLTLNLSLELLGLP